MEMQCEEYGQSATCSRESSKKKVIISLLSRRLSIFNKVAPLPPMWKPYVSTVEGAGLVESFGRHYVDRRNGNGGNRIEC